MAAKKLTFPIMGGKFKGRRLELPQTNSTRPTKSIIRGSVFDTLQYDIIDQVFIEVFGGSGSMGLEALSRGAGEVYFFERERGALRVLEQNCEKLDPSRTHVYHGDSFQRYGDLIRQLQREGKQAYIYLDPPFAIREGMDDIYDRIVQLIEKTPPDVVHKIIIEHMSGADFPEQIGPFVREKMKKFGKSSLSYYIVA
jgi:16S rRNA (guanine(966)-N(2))-methyltransferase RsmD